MNLQEIRDNYAKEKGFEDWFRLLKFYADNNGIVSIITHENKVFELIQQEQQKLIAEKINQLAIDYKIVGFVKSSIINENNIIR